MPENLLKHEIKIYFTNRANYFHLVEKLSNLLKQYYTIFTFLADTYLIFKEIFANAKIQGIVIKAAT